MGTLLFDEDLGRRDIGVNEIRAFLFGDGLDGNLELHNLGRVIHAKNVMEQGEPEPLSLSLLISLAHPVFDKCLDRLPLLRSRFHNILCFSVTTKIAIFQGNPLSLPNIQSQSQSRYLISIQLLKPRHSFSVPLDFTNAVILVGNQKNLRSMEGPEAVFVCSGGVIRCDWPLPQPSGWCVPPGLRPCRRHRGRHRGSAGPRWRS